MADPSKFDLMWSWNPLVLIPWPDYGIPNWFIIILGALAVFFLTSIAAYKIPKEQSTKNKWKGWGIGFLVLYLIVVGGWGILETSRGLTYFNAGAM